MHSRHDSHSEYLDDIKEQIRADAALARERSPLPRAPAPPVIHPDAPAPHDPGTALFDRDRRDYQLADLTGEHFITFVQHVYRQVLKREPDDAGAHNQLNLLAAGGSKVEVIGNLRYSPEGRRIGVRVPGLRWRFLLTKACRIPVLGAVLSWCLALLALPQLMRHQYAQENYFAAQHLAAKDRLASLQQDVGGLHGALEPLGARLALLETRVAALEARPEPEPAPPPEPVQEDGPGHALLLHEIHAVKHWLFSLQRTLDDVEDLTRDEQLREQQQAWEITCSQPMATARQAHHEQWLATLATRLDGAAEVLDLAGDAAWLTGLRASGLDASGVTDREAWHRQLRGQGLSVLLADPLGHLSQLTDAGLDALTVTSLATVFDAGLGALLDQAQRVLVPGGSLLLGWQDDALQQLRGRSVVPAPELVEALLGQAGFANITRIDAADGTPALLAQRNA